MQSIEERFSLALHNTARAWRRALRREPSEVDRRIKYILLTEAGRDLFAQVRTEAERFRNELLQSADKDFLQAMSEHLELLHAKADADRLGEPPVTGNKKAS